VTPGYSPSTTVLPGYWWYTPTAAPGFVYGPNTPKVPSSVPDYFPSWTEKAQDLLADVADAETPSEAASSGDKLQAEEDSEPADLDYYFPSYSKELPDLLEAGIEDE
jgi:hypothetical protein